MEEIKEQITAFFYGAIIFLQIDHSVAKILIWLILADMILGAIKAAIVPELKLSISTFWLGLIKKSMLLIFVSVLALLMKGLGYTDFREMVKVVMKIMILNEGISAINCIRSILARKEYKSSDFISMLLEKVEKFLTTWIKKLFGFFEENKNINHE